MTTIDVTTYASPHQPGYGYGVWSRAEGRYINQQRNPTGIIVHTTNGGFGSSFHGEAKWLRDSSITAPLAKRVSAHYLVGKGGEIAQIHDDVRIVWHTGRTLSRWDNNYTVGIECHFTPGERWTSQMRSSLTWLVRFLMGKWNFSTERIETHRFVALPRGRKIDPSGWIDADFYSWRSALQPLDNTIQSYRVIAGIDYAAVREGPGRSFPEVIISDTNGNTHEIRLSSGTVIGIDQEVQGEQVGQDSTWFHIAKPEAWGFVHRSLVVPI